MIISSVFQKDIEQVASNMLIPWYDMNNSSILITGVTGLVGSALAHVLAVASEMHGLNLNIIGVGRNAEKGKAIVENCNIKFLKWDVRAPFSSDYIPDTIDYILHCASITNSTDMVAKPIDVITTGVYGTINVLELARKHNSRCVVYLSSMEVYGKLQSDNAQEMDLGYLCLSNTRSSYPESKRLCENLCAAYNAQYKVPIKVARLAQTFGAGTPKDDTRVFAQFARSAIKQKNVVIHTEGKSLGNYCYTTDTILGLLFILTKGVNGETYNVANNDTSMSIRDMAELVANDICNGEVEVIVNIPSNIEKQGYAPDTGFKLNADKLKSLGWKPFYGLPEMYKRMIADWQE